ncbi:protein SREK1IP1-like [Gigantopelta aegis]|uniref:protein SREK1IP1-like n=1 Tax=Gigantopelta aegis TaxID=1735272 RepID=UPI001B887C84|nr:protein SREK1IP1-like [Gigantopelta aegis]
MHSDIQGLIKKFTNKANDGVRAACQRCGYAGHLTYQCRNFIKADPNKDVMLDVSSTSSDSSDENFVSPLVQLRQDESKKTSNVVKKKKKHKDKYISKKKTKNRERSRSPVRSRKKSDKRWTEKTTKHGQDSDNFNTEDSDSDSDSSHKHSHRKHKKHHKHKHRKKKNRHHESSDESE